MKFKKLSISTLIDEVKHNTDPDFLEENKAEMTNSINIYVHTWVHVNYGVKFGEIMYSQDGCEVTLHDYKITNIDADNTVSISFIFKDMIDEIIITDEITFVSEKTYIANNHKITEAKNRLYETRRIKQENKISSKAKKELEYKNREAKKKLNAEIGEQKKKDAKLKRLKAKIIKLESDAKIITAVSQSEDNTGDYTLEEIGKILGMSRERTRQVESSAIHKLKHPKVSRELVKYVETTSINFMDVDIGYCNFHFTEMSSDDICDWFGYPQVITSLQQYNGVSFFN